MKRLLRTSDVASKTLQYAVLAVCVASSACAATAAPAAHAEVRDNADPIEVVHVGTQPSSPGAAQIFTGDVAVTPVFGASPTRVDTVGSVTFKPGARSAWHTHPAGQLLVITAGEGWVQSWNGPRHFVKAGDVIWTPPGIKHWHGATTAESLTHFAIQTVVAGRNVDWLEPVSDADYREENTKQGEVR